jgi:uncharacterized cupredoxin-like copper-binding protein
MKLHWHRIGMLFVLGALSLGLLAACGSDSETETEAEGTTEPEATTSEPAETTVAAVLSEWAITADPATVPAGEVTFDVSNTGAIPHELAIVRTDLAADALPVADGVVNEADLDVVGRVEEFAGGAESSGTFELEAGTYVLICNIPAHYSQGMHAAFTVE